MGNLARMLVVAAAAFAMVAGACFAAADPAKGKRLFIANCSGCHTLKAAHSTAIIGPNLDKYHPSIALITYQVTHGGGVMPAFTRFTSKQVADIAAFVHAHG